MSVRSAAVREFLQEMFDTLYTHRHYRRMGEFYAANFMGHFYEDDFDFDDAVLRLKYLHAHYKNINVIIDDCIVLGDHAYVLIHTISYNLHRNESTYMIYANVYKFADGLIQEYWVMAPKPGQLDYRSGDSALPPVLPTSVFKDDVRIRFIELLDSHNVICENVIELSDLEKECLYYFLHGYSAKEIAPVLGYSYRTVEGYISVIKEKFGCSRRSELRRLLFS